MLVLGKSNTGTKMKTFLTHCILYTVVANVEAFAHFAKLLNADSGHPLSQDQDVFEWYESLKIKRGGDSILDLPLGGGLC